MNQADIPLTDEFRNAVGRFDNYSVVPVEQEQAFSQQQHVDIRSFVGDIRGLENLTTDLIMLYLDTLTMDALDKLPLSVLSVDAGALLILRKGEGWTQGNAERQPDRNSWHGITLTCNVSANPTITQSVLTT